MTQLRGQLTDRIKEKSKSLFGYEISQMELKLIPYLVYTLSNNQQLSRQLIRVEEIEILSKWKKKGYILDGVTDCGRPKISEGERLKVTKEFWDIMNEIIYLGYVDLT